MKKFFTLVLLFSSTIFVGQNTFQKNLTTNYACELTSVGSLPNGDIMVMSDSIGVGVNFTKLTANGQFIQSWYVGTNGFPQTVPMMYISPAGDIDMVSFVYNMTSFGYQVSRFSNSGAVQFSKVIYLPSDSMGSPYSNPVISYFQNGDLAVTMSNYSNLSVARMNGAGNLIWSRVLTADTTEPKDPSFTPCMTADGGMLIPGKRNCDNFFIKLDGNGNVQWSKVMNAQGIYYTHPKKVIEAAGGGYFVCGLMDEMSTFTSCGFLMKLDPNGNMLWLKNYNINPNDYFPVNEIFQLSSGELVMTSLDIYMSSKGRILVTDGNGTITKSKEFDMGSWGYITEMDLDIINGSDVLIGYSGFDASYNPINAVLRSDYLSFLWCNVSDVTVTTYVEPYAPIVTSANVVVLANNLIAVPFSLTNSASGITGVSNLCTGTGITETETFQLSLSPNPATTQLNIDLGNNFQEGMSYQIIDVLGKVYATASLTEPTSKLDIQLLSPGLYLIEVQGTKENFSRKFIKE